MLISGLLCTKPSPVGEGGPLAVDEVSKIVVLPRNTSSVSLTAATFSHWIRLFVTANRTFTHSREGYRYPRLPSPFWKAKILHPCANETICTYLSPKAYSTPTAQVRVSSFHVPSTLMALISISLSGLSVSGRYFTATSIMDAVDLLTVMVSRIMTEVRL